MITGEMFIIPNHAHGFSSVECIKRSQQEKLREIGIEPGKEEILVQVWCTNEDSDNWADHGNPFNGKYFTSYLPYTVLRDKKEGDILTIKYNGEDIQLLCKQAGHRYARFGKFEEVLAQVVA